MTRISISEDQNLHALRADRPPRPHRPPWPGLLTGVAKAVIEAALEAELDVHLDGSRAAAVRHRGGNSRNGSRTKTVRTIVGAVEIEAPVTAWVRSSR